MQWVLVAAVNQVSWSMAIMLLQPDKDVIANRLAAIEGSIALRACPFDYDPTVDPWEGMQLKQFPTQWRRFNLRQRCSYSLHPIVMSDRQLQDFVPAQVEVKGRAELTTFWPGEAQATALVARARARAKRDAPAEFGETGPCGHADPSLVGEPSDELPLLGLDDEAGLGDLEDVGGEVHEGGGGEDWGGDDITGWADKMFDDVWEELPD